MTKLKTKEKPPKAASSHMAELGETETEFRAWLHRQRDAFLSIEDRGETDLAGWVAHKMTITRSSAVSVLNWAAIENV